MNRRAQTLVLSLILIAQAAAAGPIGRASQGSVKTVINALNAVGAAQLDRLGSPSLIRLTAPGMMNTHGFSYLASFLHPDDQAQLKDFLSKTQPNVEAITEIMLRTARFAETRAAEQAVETLQDFEAMEKAISEGRWDAQEFKRIDSELYTVLPFLSDALEGRVKAAGSTLVRIVAERRSKQISQSIENTAAQLTDGKADEVSSTFQGNETSHTNEQLGLRKNETLADAATNKALATFKDYVTIGEWGFARVELMQAYDDLENTIKQERGESLRWLTSTDVKTVVARVFGLNDAAMKILLDRVRSRPKWDLTTTERIDIFYGRNDEVVNSLSSLENLNQERRRKLIARLGAQNALPNAPEESFASLETYPGSAELQLKHNLRVLDYYDGMKKVAEAHPESRQTVREIIETGNHGEFLPLARVKDLWSDALNSSFDPLRSRGELWSNRLLNSLFLMAGIGFLILAAGWAGEGGRIFAKYALGAEALLGLGALWSRWRDRVVNRIWKRLETKLPDYEVQETK